MATIYGGMGPDILTGKSEANFVYGGAGNDVITAGPAGDVLVGAGGSDVIVGGAGNDVIFGDGFHAPPFPTFGILYFGPGYTVAGIQNAMQTMLVINPAQLIQTDQSVVTGPNQYGETLWSLAQIKQMQGAGKQIYGNVNLSLVNTYTSMYKDRLTSDWVGLRIDDTTVQADFANPHWQDIVKARVGTLIAEGYNGAFLDDLEMFYDRIPTGLHQDQMVAARATNALAMRDFIIGIRDSADAMIRQRDGTLTADNRFRLIVNGAPEILQSALSGSTAFLQDPASTRYLASIDAIMVENYFSHGMVADQDSTAEIYGGAGVSILSVDTGQTTPAQRLLIESEALAKGYQPYVTASTLYNSLDPTYLVDFPSSLMTPHDDTIFGGGGDDVITGGPGNDSIDGGTGTNTAVFSGKLSQYVISRPGDGIHVLGPDGMDVLNDIQVMTFADQKVLADGIPGFLNINAASTFSSALSQALKVQEYAHYDLYQANAGAITNAGQNLSQTGLGTTGDLAVYTSTGPGHTISVTGTGQSVIAAGDGADVVTVANGRDLIATGTGANTVNLTSGTNTLFSEGADTVTAGSGSDTITLSGSIVLTPLAAQLSVFLNPGAMLTLHTGTGPVQVQGGYGAGSFSGGLGGDNVLVAGTGPTTLYAGGDQDLLVASGGSGTVMNGWGGSETMVGQYSSGANTFNLNGANVFATGGAGTNLFAIGTGRNNIVGLLGRDTYAVVNGAAGGSTYISDFKKGTDLVHLVGYASDEASHALSHATFYQGSEILTLRDGTSLSFGGVTGLALPNFA